MKLLLIDRLRYLTSIRRLTIKKDAHNPQEIETKWYDLWQKKLQNANLDTKRPYFSMILPPPNVTGTLHLGHAITLTIQDVIIRRNLMNGYRTVWIPGVDHAGIATQVIANFLLPIDTFSIL
jgi:valyl-tRNA synthetase